MPSSHVCNNVALALLVCLIYRNLFGKLFWIWPFLMSLSRIYLGDHYPSDVLVSWFLALSYTALICILAQKLWEWLGSKWMCNIYENHPKLFSPLQDSTLISNQILASKEHKR